MTTQLYLKICEYLRAKISGTRWEGHVYTVGGCCRDMALGAEIKDVDLAVDLPNGGIEFASWLFKQRLTTGRPTMFEKYGTAMLRLRAFPHDDIEIVQTRAEKYTDRNSRNPQTAFGSIYDDCMRRDLTINALYYNITDGKLLDITGKSLDDLKNKVIATPLDPDSTYDDDPIRILRTIRFACRLGWELPQPVFEAMCRNSSRLDIIKVERLRGEFEKILLGPNAGRALDILFRCGALKMIVPVVIHTVSEHYLPGNSDTVWAHTLRAIDLLPPDLTLRWACLLCNCGSSLPDRERQCRHKVLGTLIGFKYHQPLLKDVVFLCVNHAYTASWGKYSEDMNPARLRRLQYLCGRPDKMNALLTLIDAFNKTLPDGYAMPEQVQYIRLYNDSMHRDGTEMFTYHLPFAERRIKKILHIEPGPLVDDTLDYMMDLAFANPKRSRAEFEQLVAKYTPKVPTPERVLIADEIRPSAKQPKSAKLPHTNTKRPHRNSPKSPQDIMTAGQQDATKSIDKISKQQKHRRHHHRRRKPNKPAN
ncbi:MAG: hypothetical protein NC217_02245 [Muribaculaceae bacterium]|nr:hypothetical protein [Muribaculaceae bacterium]